jgi:putative ABC transport system permease protein
MRTVTLKGLRARRLRLALTALAIVLRVTFVTGTLVLGDTLNSTFNSLIGTAYQHVSFEIRGRAAFTNSSAALDSTAYHKPVPESIAPAVRRLSGIAFVDGSVQGQAQFVAPNGTAVKNGGAATEGFSYDPDPQVSSVRLAAGHAPTAADDVVMDKATATKYHFAIGDRVRVLFLTGAPRTFTIAGIVTFGSDDNLLGETIAGFSLPTAQALFDSRGRYDTIDVLAKPGADNVALQSAIARVLPPGVQVVSGQTVAGELTSAVDSELAFISIALLVFAFIALFVGGFTIFNTFSITVGQRTRELALLRVVGASRRQLFQSVLGEAALMGLAASLVGLGLGVLAALGLKALLSGFGITLPSAPLVFEPRTAVVAIAVGVGVTMISAIIPARRAVRIAPVAALVEHSEDEPESSRRRVLVGGIVAAIGVLVLVAGLTKPAIALVGLGTLAVFVAAGMLAPIVARPMAGLLGRPLAALLGTPGKLGRENAMRNPRRTAQTAAALMVGLALVSAIAVIGASLSASGKSSVDNAVAADYLITGSGGSSAVSDWVAPIVARVPGVNAVAAIYSGQFQFDGSLSSLTATTPAHLAKTVHLSMTAGSAAPALASGELLIDTTTASADHLTVGSVAAAVFAQTGPTKLRIGGIYQSNALVGSFVVDDAVFAAHFDNPEAGTILVSAAPGLESTFNSALSAYPDLTIQTRAQYEAAQQESINSLLGLIYVMLALAVLIALIGIVNTLMLSVFERTREIGLLRAVGMKRPQVRAMIRSESVIIALFGAVTGLLIGTALGVALAASLRQSGVSTISIPVSILIVFLILAALLGVAAARWPARRAARLGVLAAIATE